MNDAQYVTAAVLRAMGIDGTLYGSNFGAAVIDNLNDFGLYICDQRPPDQVAWWSADEPETVKEDCA